MGGYLQAVLCCMLDPPPPSHSGAGCRQALFPGIDVPIKVYPQLVEACRTAAQQQAGRAGVASVLTTGPAPPPPAIPHSNSHSPLTALKHPLASVSPAPPILDPTTPPKVPPGPNKPPRRRGRVVGVRGFVFRMSDLIFGPARAENRMQSFVANNRAKLFLLPFFFKTAFVTNAKDFLRKVKRNIFFQILGRGIPGTPQSANFFGPLV